MYHELNKKCRNETAAASIRISITVLCTQNSNQNSLIAETYSSYLESAIYLHQEVAGHKRDRKNETETVIILTPSSATTVITFE
jgi:hypothetical protein